MNWPQMIVLGAMDTKATKDATLGLTYVKLLIQFSLFLTSIITISRKHYIGNETE